MRNYTRAVRRASIVALLGLLVLAGCGSGSSSETDAHTSAATLAVLAARAPTVLPLTAGTGDLAPGRLRFTFLVVASDGRTIDRPRASVWLARGRDRPPFERVTARLESVAPDAADEAFEPLQLYVAHLDVPAPGRYWLLARPQGSRAVALGEVVVKRRTASPEIGARAPRSRTPTLATTGGRLAPLTTDPTPDRHLYAHSLAESLRSNAPSVVAFATPAFCASRTCGPVVDVVSQVRRELDDDRLRFIHVEVYEDNDPANGHNRWMKEWRLESEPWVFLVGADGRIAEKFEGAVSVRELRAAVQRHLMR